MGKNFFNPLQGFFARMSTYVPWKVTLMCILSVMAVSLSAKAEAPNRSVEIGSNYITVSYNLTGDYEVSELTDGKIFHDISGFGHCTEEGKPMVPMRIDTFKIPLGYNVSIEIQKGVVYEISGEYTGVEIPAIESSSDPAKYGDIVAYEGLYPSESAIITSGYVQRHQILKEVCVSPVQYDYENQKVFFYPQLSYTLTFTESDSFPYTDIQAEHASQDDLDNDLPEFLKTSLVTSENTIGGIKAVDEAGFVGKVGYLIVTTDEYKQLADQFGEWKSILGYTPFVLTQSKWNSYEQVLESIRTMIAENPEIVYLLILGDLKDVPSKYVLHPEGYNYYTDRYYSTPNDETYLSDVYMGRIPISDEWEGKSILTKLARLEMCPVMDEHYYNQAVHCGYYQTESNKQRESRRFIQTSEIVKDYVNNHNVTVKRNYRATDIKTPTYFYDGTPLPNDLLYPNFNWACTAEEICDDLNKGVLYALYRGHGSASGWGNVGFNKNDFANLESNEMPYTVFSVTCQTGMFNNDCFAENFLKVRNGGAASVIAASQVSYSNYNDAFVKGMFEAIWPEPGIFSPSTSFTSNIAPIYRVSQILSQGLFKMNEMYGYNKDIIKHQNEVFHLFGDPSILFFTENPKSFSNVDIQRNQSYINVDLNGEIGSIGFYNFRTGESYKYESDSVTFPTKEQKNVIVCITGHNKLTYVDSVHEPVVEESLTTQTCQPYYLSLLNSAAETSVKNMKTEKVATDEEVQVLVTDILGRTVYSAHLPYGAVRDAIAPNVGINGGCYVINVVKDNRIVESKKVYIQ